MPTDAAPDEGITTAPDEFELRQGFRRDLYSLPEVFVAATSGPGHPPDNRTPREIRSWCLHLLDRRDREVWVALRDEVSLGFVLLEGEWVNLILVHPDRQARGVGAALLDLVKSLRPHGFGLRVYQANERARVFYRRHGLVELESTDGSSHQDAEPDVHMAWLGDDPLAYLRRRIDALDDDLAVLLARRTALTGAVQEHRAAYRAASGEQGRDPGREAEIVERMARRVPGLGPERIARVMHTVIEESIAAWEGGPGSGTT